MPVTKSSKVKSEPLIRNEHIEADTPSMGETLIKLYHHNVTWRGAADMVVIGTIMLLVANGLPIGWLSSDQKPPIPIAQPATSNTVTPAANFSPANPAKQGIKVPSAFSPNDPVPDFVKTKSWVTKLDKDEETILLDAYADLLRFNYTQAIEKLTPKAEGKNSDFQVALAFANLSNGDKQKAFYWQREAAFSGHKYAQYELAQYYRLGLSGAPNVQEAIKWYERAVLNGNAAAANELARLYEKGVGVVRDEHKAFEYYQKAADGGSEFGQSNVGAAYYNGTLGVRQDYQKAVYWIRLAAEQGYDLAQLNLALAYYRGRVDGKPDNDNFLVWAGRAADQGNVPAMLELADYYREKRPQGPDNQLAASWYRQAALKKDAKAQFMLARMYQEGAGVPQDNIQAYVYYSLANRGGFGQAIGALSEIKKSMSAGELEHAESLAKGLTVPSAQQNRTPATLTIQSMP